MPNYIVRSCTSGEESIIYSAAILFPDDIIDFYLGESGPFCGKVISDTTDTQEGTGGNHIYTDCCSCILTEMTDILSLDFQTCDDRELLIDIGVFCTIYGDVPNLNDVFLLTNTETGSQTCATHTGYSIEGGVTTWEPESEGPFNFCWECTPKDFPPRSANTETTVCVICCDCGSTASTINQVVALHPVWTDGYGASVTQLNMITIGGNGLNS
jgi:hypothetical protein